MKHTRSVFQQSSSRHKRNCVPRNSILRDSPLPDRKYECSLWVISNGFLLQSGQPSLFYHYYQILSLLSLLVMLLVDLVSQYLCRALSSSCSHLMDCCQVCGLRGTHPPSCTTITPSTLAIPLLPNPHGSRLCSGRDSEVQPKMLIDQYWVRSPHTSVPADA